MTRPVNVWKCFIIFCYILQPVCTGTTYTSKACYGAYGLVCTRHDISCNSNQKIAIYDAYFTNNTECSQTGLSSCVNISVDGVTEHGYHRFNNTVLVSLFNTCSTKSQCVFQGPHGGATGTFSVVKYQCIEGKHKAVTECSQTGLSSCGNFNTDGLAEYGYHRFYNTELVSLFITCSTKSRCVYVAPRRSDVRTFSVVKYRCIAEDASLNISGSSGEGLSQVSLFNTDEPMATSTIQNNAYVCSFKSDDPTTSITVYSLDVRIRRRTPGQCLSQFTVLPANYLTVNNCSTMFHPFERLNVTAKFPVSIYLDIPSVSSPLIWLLINASDPFDVRCQPFASTGDITTRPNKDVLPIRTSSRFPVGVFMGGVAAGAVIVILVGLAVYVLVIRRRYDLTSKKQGDTPASVQHPTYSGLSAGGDVNNYTSIEQTSRSQEDSTHGSTATPDYQNI